MSEDVVHASVPMLVERDREQRLFAELLDGARIGNGAVLAVEGPAGIGKTELLRAFRRQASELPVRVLAARGGELERDLAFGVVRQLFEPAVFDVVEGERDQLLSGAADGARGVLGLSDGADLPVDQFAVLHGLYWLCVGLSELEPLLLVIDDAHWCDAQTLRWLSFLLHRLEGLPVMVVLAARPREPSSVRELLEAVLVDPTVDLLTLAPLGSHSVGELVRAGLGGDADDAFCAACHTASGGNPFLLRQLVRAAKDDEIAPHAENASLVGELGRERVGRSLLLRIATLGQDCVAVAQALAVLGPDARINQLVALSGLDAPTVVASVDRLAAVELFSAAGPLDFAHPLVRAAVYGELLPAKRSLDHKRAAQLFVDAGAGGDRIAAQLLATDPDCDPWTVEQLRVSAGAALARGVPEAAVMQLGRALAEPPAPELRVELVFELGMASLRVDPGLAVEHLTAALELTDVQPRRATVALMLARALGFSGSTGQAAATLDRALGELADADRELGLRILAEFALWSLFTVEDATGDDWSARLRPVASPLTGSTGAEQSLLGVWAWRMTLAGEPVDEVLSVAERAAARGVSFVGEPGFEASTLIASSLMYCDCPGRAHDLFAAGIAELREWGQLVQSCFAYGHAAHAQLRAGSLLDAEADARTGVALAVQFGPALPGWWYAIVNLIAVMIARGLIDEAGEIVDQHWPPGPLPEAMIYPFPLVVRGELRVAQGRHEEAVEDLLAAGRWMEEQGHIGPAWTNWPTAAVPPLLALGRAAEARQHAELALTRARRFGAAGTVGRALRAAGLAVDRDEHQRHSLLAESVAVLESSPCRLELAESLVELGAFLRRTKQRIAARERLAAGLEVAAQCGAGLLADRARDELAATGARPRRELRSGVDALTASELRVARLAADGSSNVEIAQALYVTKKTIEKHLANSYVKLEIDGRPGLARALG